MKVPLMMPYVGLSFFDVSLAALQCGGNKSRTARRLGVDRHALKMAIDRENLHHWFAPGKTAPRPQGTCVTKQQIIQVAKEGYTRADAAYLLGISRSYLKDLINRWGLAEHFLSRGESVKVNRNGYAI